MTRPEHDLTFIVGGDMASSLPTWREPEAVLALARWPSPSATGTAATRSRERLEPLDGAERVDFFDMPRIDISSSRHPPARRRGAARPLSRARRGRRRDRARGCTTAAGGLPHDR